MLLCTLVLHTLIFFGVDCGDTNVNQLFFLHDNVYQLLCKICVWVGRTEGRTDGRTDERMEGQAGGRADGDTSSTKGHETDETENKNVQRHC